MLSLTGWSVSHSSQRRKCKSECTESPGKDEEGEYSHWLLEGVRIRKATLDSHRAVGGKLESAHSSFLLRYIARETFASTHRGVCSPWGAGANSYQLAGPQDSNSPQLCVGWHHISSLNSVAARVFTTWKLTNTTKQGSFFLI